MSWSVQGIGRAAQVADHLAKQFSENACIEPEETIRQLVAKAVAIALGSFPIDAAVRVEASGSQGTHSQHPTVATHYLTLRIEPLHSFIQ